MCAGINIVDEGQSGGQTAPDEGVENLAPSSAAGAAASQLTDAFSRAEVDDGTDVERQTHFGAVCSAVVWYLSAAFLDLLAFVARLWYELPGVTGASGNPLTRPPSADHQREAIEQERGKWEARETTSEVEKAAEPPDAGSEDVMSEEAVLGNLSSVNGPRHGYLRVSMIYRPLAAGACTILNMAGLATRAWYQNKNADSGGSRVNAHQSSAEASWDSFILTSVALLFGLMAVVLLLVPELSGLIGRYKSFTWVSICLIVFSLLSIAAFVTSVFSRPEGYELYWPPYVIMASAAFAFLNSLCLIYCTGSLPAGTEAQVSRV